MADIIYLVERLEQVLSQGWRVPFTTNAVIDEDAFIDVIEQMHIAIPTEIRQAQQLVQQKEQFIADARTEAEGMVEDARREADELVENATREADRLVTETDIVAQAQQRAERIAAEAHREAERIRGEAQREAEAIRTGADSYAVEVLARIRNELNVYLRQVDNGLARLQPKQASEELPDEEEERPTPSD